MTFWEILSTPFLLLWTMLTKLWIPAKDLMDNHPLFKIISIITGIMTAIYGVFIYLKRRR